MRRKPKSCTGIIYVSLEFWHCICMEKTDPRRKLPKYSFCSLNKTVGLILQAFEVFVSKVLQQWRTFFKQIFYCMIFTFHINLWSASLWGGMSGNTDNIRLLPYESHLRFVSNINALFKTDRCPSCDQFIKTVHNGSFTWRGNWLLAKKDLNMFLQKRVSIARNTNWQTRLFEYPSLLDQKLFKILALFDFESICVQKTKSALLMFQLGLDWISVSISSNLIEQPFFLYSSNSGAFVEYFIEAIDSLATHSKAQLKLNILEF